MTKGSHKLLDEQTLAETVAREVEEAEARHPGSGLGAIKRSEVVDRLVGLLPFRGPCAPVLRTLVGLIVGILVEIAVAAFQRKWKRANERQAKESGGPA